jgi:hypothetical protein
MTNIDTQETDYSVYADILLAWSQLHWNCYMFLFKICFLSQCQQKKHKKKCPNNKYRHTRDRLFGLISAQLKSHLMWSKVELPEATSPEVTRNDVTGNHVTGGDRVRMRNRFPRFFSYYSSSTQCTIAHDRHGYRMWRHQASRDLEGIPLEGWGARMCNQKLRNIRPSGAF